MVGIEEHRSRDEIDEITQAAIRVRTEFLTNLSHELRTPLAGVTSALELVLADESLGKEHQENLQLARKSAVHLQEKIDAILDLSKIEGADVSLHPEPFLLRETVEELIERFKARAKVQMCEIVVAIDQSLPNVLIGDANRLRQVLSNLISNAVKFSSEHGGVIVYATEIDQTENEIEIQFCVADTGIGVPANMLDIIFQPFVQVDGSATRRFGGVGLGLAIAKNVVGIWGGRIWADSRPGMGSAFYFTISLAKTVSPVRMKRVIESAAEEAKREESLRSPSKPEEAFEVLLVEDNSINRLLLRRILEKHGHQVTEATNGRECIEILEAHSFDVVLMDCQMPIMSGFEATSKIRTLEQETGLHLPIVAITAHAMPGDRERCLSVGMDRYLTKPVGREKLLSTITEVVGSTTDEHP